MGSSSPASVFGLTQQEFAALVGVSTPQIARLERGEANPTLATLQAVGKPYRLQVGFVHPDTRLPDGPDTQVAPPASSKPRLLPPLSFDKPAKS